MTRLTDLGWGTFFETRFAPYRQEGFIPARVACEEKSAYLVWCEAGELSADVTGKLRHEAAGKGDRPAVGDWVVIAPRFAEGRATIHALLPRRTSFSRKAAGATTDEQVAAANVDTVFLVSGLDHDYNVRRIERYVTVAYDSGADPVIVLNKADVCPDVEARMAEIEVVALGVPVHPVSAATGEGFQKLARYLAPGRTVALLGSSGVGKSSIVNRLLGEERMAVQSVREHDSRGRHTTTRRELICSPGGGIVIDTPGMRELQLWSDAGAVGESFRDIETLAAGCRFADCRHAGEPGCAVRAAIEDGTLAAARLESYRRLARELAHLEKRQAYKARLADKASRINAAHRSGRRADESE